MRDDVFKRILRTGRMLAVLALAGSYGWSPVSAATTSAQSPALGAHTLLAQSEGKGVSPAITTVLTTQDSGSSLLMFDAGWANNSQPPTDSAGNTWKQVAHDVYRGYQDRFDARAWVATTAHGGSDHTVRAIKNGNPAGETTLGLVEIHNAGILQDMASNYPAPNVFNRFLAWLVQPFNDHRQERYGGTARLTSGAVTTTGPATLIAVWWGDAPVYRMTAVPDNGFKMIDHYLTLPPNSGVQCAVASREVAAAGTYRATWTGRPAQGAILWLFAFQSRQGPAG